jgi:hypothetical protein
VRKQALGLLINWASWIGGIPPAHRNYDREKPTSI